MLADGVRATASLRCLDEDGCGVAHIVCASLHGPKQQRAIAALETLQQRGIDLDTAVDARGGLCWSVFTCACDLVRVLAYRRLPPTHPPANCPLDSVLLPPFSEILTVH